MAKQTKQIVIQRPATPKVTEINKWQISPVRNQTPPPPPKES